MKKQTWKSLSRHFEGVVVTAFVGLTASACNTALDTDSFRTDGCPTAGTIDCLDATTPRVCGANGQWEQRPVCVNQTCNAGNCVGLCAPGKRCTGNVTEMCDDAGQWFADVECTGQTCINGDCKGVCTSGAKDCATSDTPKVCGADGLWVVEAKCVGQTCNQGDCVGVCAPGKRCAGNVTEMCDDAGQWFADVECTGQTCINGDCKGVCTSGAKDCATSDTPKVCGADGLWVVEAKCVGQTCNQGDCVGVCAPGQRCTGNVTEMCDDAGQWFADVECTGQTCINGDCKGVCTSGAKDCVTSDTPKVCGADGLWIVEATCVGQTCNQGDCVGVCAPGKRCTGNAIEVCDGQGQWNVDIECTGQTCINGNCKGVCTAGTKGCETNDTPKVCGVDGLWVVGGTCIGQTCNAGDCVGICAPGRRCGGNTIQECNGNGQWANVEACAAPKHCEAGECVVECTSGDLRCIGNTPGVCDANGSWTSGPTCVGQTCDLGQCTGSCGPLDATCFDLKTPQTCDRHGQLQQRTPCVGNCFQGSCPGPSCAGLPDTCGPNGNENCCLSPQVLGGTFNRGNDPDYPATVNDFRLDRFEVTVGRYRKFMNSGPNTPQPGDGAHPLIPGSGWDSLWNPAFTGGLGSLASYSPATYAAMDASNELRPMNNASWYVAFAFCAWDGGRLPTEAEWHYAASGGDEQRIYPWGFAEPDYNLAVYDCAGGGSPLPGGSCTLNDIIRVGSKSPLGDSKFGQADLAGSMWEWALDVKAAYVTPCDNCANLIPQNSDRVMRAGQWNFYPMAMAAIDRGNFPPSQADQGIGFRCARKL